MGKIVRRLLLDDACDIGHNESWFGAMAQQGLHLKKYGIMSVQFERGEPKNTRYRAEIVSDKPTEEQLSLYREGGWNYVTSNRFVAIFAADGNAAVSELHTDPVEQGYTIEPACKSARNNAILMVMTAAIIALLLISTITFSPEPIYTIITGQSVQQFCLLVVELYAAYVVINNYWTLRRLRKGLLAGIPIRHDLPYRTHRTISAIIAAVFLLFSLATLALPIGTLTQQGRFLLPTELDTLPILRLAEIEQNPALVRDVGLDRNNFDRANSVRYEWSPLAPVQYEADEHGVIEAGMWADGSGTYSPSMHTRYYELTFSDMAQPLMDDLIGRYEYRYERSETTEISTPLFDEVQFSRRDSRSALYARKGNRVISIIYIGTASPEKLLPLLADRWRV